MPGAGHGSHIIKQVAFGLFDRAEVRNNLCRFHHHFAEQQAAWADDFTNHAHHPHKHMYLREIAAVGAEFLPYVRHGVQTDDVDSLVAQEQHVFSHVVEDHRVRIVQIPLIGIKGGHDNLVRFRAPAEVPGGGGGEDLRNVFFIFLRDAPVVVEKEAILEFLFSRTCPARPDMVFTGMVHYKIQTQGNTAAVTVFRQSF